MPFPRVPKWGLVLAAWTLFILIEAALITLKSPIATPFSEISLLLLIWTGFGLPWRVSLGLLLGASALLTLAGPNSLNLHISLGGGPLPAGASLLLVGAVLLGLGAFAQLALAGARRAGRAEGQRESAEQELQRLRMVLDSAGHELKNALTPLALKIEMLRMDAETAALGDAMARTTGRMTRLTGDLSDAARSLDGKLTVKKRSCDLARLVSNITGEYEEPARVRQLTVETEIPRVIPAFVDQERTEQVVANLLQNAIRYTPEGGAVTVRATIRGDEAFIEVRDTGRGLSRDEMDRLFQPFVRFHPDEVPGSGWGFGSRGTS